MHEGSLETRPSWHCFTEAKFQMFKLPVPKIHFCLPQRTMDPNTTFTSLHSAVGHVWSRWQSPFEPGRG